MQNYLSNQPSEAFLSVVFLINPFVPNAPFLYPLKASENLEAFLRIVILINLFVPNTPFFYPLEASENLKRF